MAKAKLPEVENRLFNRVFVCQVCGSKIKADLLKVTQGKAKCRNCKSKQLRKIHKEHKV